MDLLRTFLKDVNFGHPHPWQQLYANSEPRRRVPSSEFRVLNLVDPDTGGRIVFFPPPDVVSFPHSPLTFVDLSLPFVHLSLPFVHLALPSVQPSKLLAPSGTMQQSNRLPTAEHG